MSKETKILLMVLAGLTIVGGVYWLYKSNQNKSGNSEKDNRKIVIRRTN